MEVKIITIQKIVDMLIEEGINNKIILDIGCGSGGLTFPLSSYAKKVIGIDISSTEIARANSIAENKMVKNVEFYEGDADSIEYRGFIGGTIDIVASNLCMSSEIIKRSSRALKPGSLFVFACFHSDQLKELGGSRFSFGEDEMKKLLERSGFIVESIEVKKWIINLPVEEKLVPKSEQFPWAKRRMKELARYINEGGRIITQSRLIVKARRK